MARRSERNVARRDYYKDHHGLQDSEEMFDIHADDDFADVEPDVLDGIIESEGNDISKLEEQVKLMQQQEDEAQKRKAILDRIDNLQVMRQKRAVLEKIIAGELPPSAMNWNQGKPSASSATPASGLRPDRPTSSAFKQHSKPPPGPPGISMPSSSGEYDDLLNTIVHLRQGNLAPFTSMMSNTALGQGQARKHLRFDKIEQDDLAGKFNSNLNLGRPLSLDNGSSLGNNGAMLGANESLSDNPLALNPLTLGSNTAIAPPKSVKGHKGTGSKDGNGSKISIR